MTERPDQAHEAAEAALVLATELKTFRTEVTGLKSTTKSNRKMIRVLGVSFALDLFLSFGFGYVAFRAQVASDKAAEATSAQVMAQRRDFVTCLSANDARAANRELWDFVLAIPAPVTETAEAAERRAESTRRFTELLNRVSAQRTC